MDYDSLSNDELADVGRGFFAALHARVDASDHPRKARLQRLVKVGHGAISDVGEIVNDDTGSGHIVARAGDPKD